MTEYTGRIGVGNTRTMQVGDGVDSVGRAGLLMSVYDASAVTPAIEMHLPETEVIRLAALLKAWLDTQALLRSWRRGS